MPANIVFVLIGLGAGVLGGMFGIAGGIVIVPGLIYLARFQPQVATGTSLAVFLMPVGILGVYNYYKEGNIRIAPALLIGAGLFVGAYFGSRIAHAASPLILKRGFALLMVATAARMWFTK